VGLLLLIHFIRSLVSIIVALASQASRSLWTDAALTQSLRALNWELALGLSLSNKGLHASGICETLFCFLQMKSFFTFSSTSTLPHVS
jgi:hypothetical protein